MKKIFIALALLVSSTTLFSCQDESKEVFQEAEVTIEDATARGGLLLDYDSWSD